MSTLALQGQVKHYIDVNTERISEESGIPEEAAREMVTQELIERLKKYGIECPELDV